MKFEYCIKSPCKINLSLDVHNKRSDGYHDLTSIFQLVSLEDTIRAIIKPSSGIEVIGDFDCCVEDNLIYKAANMFLKKAKINDGVCFKIEKKIPSGGGIGGGSSNCASVLRLLNTIYDHILTDNEMFDIALSLGSDVPFFLGNGTALVQGRGEEVLNLETIKGFEVLLVNPGIHISTGKAFRTLSNSNISTKRSSEFSANIVAEYRKGINNFSIFKNSFEIALYSDYTFIKQIKEIMYKEGAILSALSGSGSTMFGIFPNQKNANRAVATLSKNKLYKIFMVKPIDKFPNVTKREIL